MYLLWDPTGWDKFGSWWYLIFFANCVYSECQKSLTKRRWCWGMSSFFYLTTYSLPNKWPVKVDNAKLIQSVKDNQYLYVIIVLLDEWECRRRCVAYLDEIYIVWIQFFQLIFYILISDLLNNAQCAWILKHLNQ